MIACNTTSILLPERFGTSLTPSAPAYADFSRAVSVADEAAEAETIVLPFIIPSRKGFVKTEYINLSGRSIKTTPTKSFGRLAQHIASLPKILSGSVMVQIQILRTWKCRGC